MSKLQSDKLTIEFDNVQIHIGEIVGADYGRMKLLDTSQGKSGSHAKAMTDEEKPRTIDGPTPVPGLTGLRSWDHRLLERYSPVYTPTSDTCEYCTYGKCDLTGNKEGACGIDLATQQSREALKTAIMGAACHSAHGRHLLEIEGRKVTKVKKIKNRKPVDEYLRMQKRFSHLFSDGKGQDVIRKIQDTADWNVEYYGLE